jgi:MFS family permease
MSSVVPDLAAPESQGLWNQLRSMSRPFWMVNIMEMFERLAYYGVRVVMPIYIAQADEINGLHFTQADKGTIYLWWAIFQSLTPMLLGGFADRYGYKKTIATSVFIKMLGYVLMATQREFWPFLAGCCVLALGTAVFKPGVQGTMCQTLTKKNSSVGFGMFYMVVNVGGFLGPPLAHYLYGYSWPTVFYGCAGIVSLNLLMLFTYKDPASGSVKTNNPFQVFLFTIREFFNLRLITFIVIMAGFWFMFMQLFDLLPNFIVDWVDSSRVVHDLGIPSWMLQLNSPRAPQISQEWMININAGLIVLCVVFVSFLVSKMRRVMSIFTGITIASVGLVLAGFTTSGYFCLAGILCFSVGEMMASPKMSEYLGMIAPEGKKGLYMGYANMPNGLGWAIGSIYAGNLYADIGEKANLAVNYLSSHYNLAGVPRTEAMNKLMEVSGLTAQQATDLLWDVYHPYKIWYRFAAIGMAAAVGIFFYARWVRKYEAADV